DDPEDVGGDEVDPGAVALLAAEGPGERAAEAEVSDDAVADDEELLHLAAKVGDRLPEVRRREEGSFGALRSAGREGAVDERRRDRAIEVGAVARVPEGVEEARSLHRLLASGGGEARVVDDRVGRHEARIERAAHGGAAADENSGEKERERAMVHGAPKSRRRSRSSAGRWHSFRKRRRTR